MRLQSRGEDAQTGENSRTGYLKKIRLHQNIPIYVKAVVFQRVGLYWLIQSVTQAKFECENIFPGWL